MEEPQKSTVSEEETILKKENNSEVTMDEPQTPTESADPSASGCESVTKPESVKQLHLFVTLLTVRVLEKCNALQYRSLDNWVAYTKRLTHQTMERLTDSQGFCPEDLKSTKKVSKAVLKDLQKKYHGRWQLESVISSQDPDVEAAIVQSLQTHIRDYFAQLAKKAATRRWWRDTLQVVVFTVGLLASLVLIALIP